MEGNNISPKNVILISGPFSGIIRDVYDVINVDTTLGAVDLYLQNIKQSNLLYASRLVYINDVGLNLSVNNLTIFGSLGDLVNNSLSIIVSSNGANLQCNVATSNEWTVSGLPASGGGTVTSADNGLKLVGTVVKLGGFLLAPTAIDLSGFNLNFQNGLTPLLSINPNGSIGVGTATQDASSLLDLTSTTRGFLPPRMTTAQRNAIAVPANSLFIYNTDTSHFNFWNGLTWQVIQSDITPPSTLAQVLVASNITGGKPISMSLGDTLNFNVGLGGVLNSSSTTALQNWLLPDDSGTIALTSQIPSTAIALNYIPKGTGTSIVDGTWQFLGNDILPITTGSNIGDATHRIGTIFMASVFDYANDLVWYNGTSNTMTLTTAGNVGIGIASPLAKLHIKNINDTSGNYSFRIEAFASATPILQVRNDGYLYGSFLSGIELIANDAVTNLGSSGGSVTKVVLNGGAASILKIQNVGFGEAVYYYTGSQGGASNEQVIREELTTGSSNASIANFGRYMLIKDRNPVAGIRVDTVTGLLIRKDPTNTNTSLRYSSANFADGYVSVGFGDINYIPDATLEVKGINSTSSNYALKVDNSASSPLLYVKNDGTIGIGTTNPTQKLEVNGHLRFSSANQGLYFTDNVIANSWNQRVNSGSMTFTQDGIGTWMYIYGAGNLDNISPGVALRGSSSLRVGGYESIWQNYDQYTRMLLVASGGSGTSIVKALATDGVTTLFNLQGDGKVGIGIALPTAKVHIQGDSSITGYALKVENSGAQGLLKIKNDGAFSLGLDATNYSNISVTIGGSALTTHQESVAIGMSSRAHLYSTVIGSGASDLGYSANTIIGQGSTTNGTSNVLVGVGNNVVGARTYIFGTTNNVSANDSIVIGYNMGNYSTLSLASGSLAIGNYNSYGTFLTMTGSSTLRTFKIHAPNDSGFNAAELSLKSTYFNTSTSASNDYEFKLTHIITDDIPTSYTKFSFGSNEVARLTNSYKLGVGTISPTATLHLQGVDSTSSNYALKVDSSSSSPLLYVRNDGNVGLRGASFGGGVGVLFKGFASTVPTTNPIAGVVDYVENVGGGVQKYRDTNGTIVAY